MAKIATNSKRETASTVKKTAQAGRDDSAAHRDIERLAYQFYVDRGYQDGFDREDWARAEAIVKGKRAS